MRDVAPRSRRIAIAALLLGLATTIVCAQIPQAAAAAVGISAKATSTKAASTRAATGHGNPYTADFNGDGYGDLAIGVPGEDIDRDGTNVPDSGGVNVLYGTSNGLSSTAVSSTFWGQGTPKVQGGVDGPDRFGQTLSWGDFNDDGYDDLVVGAPGEAVSFGGNDLYQAGAVNVLYGSPTGLSATAVTDQLWDESVTGVSGDPQSGDLFGASLATGDFNKDGYADLAIGVPGESVPASPGPLYTGSVTGGSVQVLFGSTTGLSATAVPGQEWSQSSTDVEGVAANGDGFGTALTSSDFNGDGFADLAVGVTQEPVTVTGTVQAGAGAVNVLYGSTSGLSSSATVADQLWTQASPGMPGKSETGDAFGQVLTSADLNQDGYDDLAVGVPFEGVPFGGGNVTRAGEVDVIYGSSSGLSTTWVPTQRWDEGTPSAPGDPETDDEFGAALTIGDFNGDGPIDLAVGVPYESIVTAGVSKTQAGAVVVLYATTGGLTASASGSVPASPIWDQDSTGVKGEAELWEHFGAAVSAGDFNGDTYGDLAVGTWDDMVEIGGVATFAGGVNVIHGSATGVDPSTLPADQLWNQSSSGVQGTAENGDQLGWALAS